MSKRTIVVLDILDDNEDRPWYEALGIPEPARWNAADFNTIGINFPPTTDVHAAVKVEEVVA